MHAQLVGLWDAMNLWTQWDDVAPETGYRLQLALRAADGEWSAWQDIGGPGPLRRAWLVVPLWKAGHEVRARVAVFGTEDWADAAEAVFLRSRCRFEISTAQRRVHYQKGTAFASHVDAAGCHYRLNEEVEIEPGGRIEVGMTAAAATGWSQLDHENHFDFRPALGVRIRNVAPSEQDLELTGRAFTVLAARPRDTPLKVTFGGENF